MAERRVNIKINSIGILFEGKMKCHPGTTKLELSKLKIGIANIDNSANDRRGMVDFII